MKKLDCNVTSFLHNYNDHCCKQAIIVDGSKEKGCCDIYYGNFDENRYGASDVSHTECATFQMT